MNSGRQRSIFVDCNECFIRVSMPILGPLITLGGLAPSPVTIISLLPLLAVGITLFRYQTVDPESHPLNVVNVSLIIVYYFKINNCFRGEIFLSASSGCDLNFLKLWMIFKPQIFCSKILLLFRKLGCSDEEEINLQQKMLSH